MDSAKILGFLGVILVGVAVIGGGVKGLKYIKNKYGIFAAIAIVGIVSLGLSLLLS